MIDGNSTISNKKSVKQKKLYKRLRRNLGKAIADYNMIEDGDRIMACISGGKDSFAMLDLLNKIKADAPVNFEIVAVNLDQKQPGFPADTLPNWLTENGFDFHIIEEDTYSIVQDKLPENATMCSLCSRLRRGIFYRFAEENGFNKIALGHHRDDMIETMFLNMFFGGKLSSMPPKLQPDNEKAVVIRPLAYCLEKDLEDYAVYENFPIIPCNLCGSQENLQRKKIKKMLRQWDEEHKDRSNRIFAAMQNISLSHMLDRNAYDFTKF